MPSLLSVIVLKNEIQKRAAREALLKKKSRAPSPAPKIVSTLIFLEN
jgi:hypothetical protein